MKKNNKKGFTLIELLAVIVILAILATAAFTLVIPRIQEARKNTFVTEAANMIDAAEGYFVQHSSASCVKISTLLSKGLVKGDINTNVGYVTYTAATTSSSAKFSVAYRNATYETKASSNKLGLYEMKNLRDNDGNASTNVVDKTSAGIGYPSSCD